MLTAAIRSTAFHGIYTRPIRTTRCHVSVVSVKCRPITYVTAVGGSMQYHNNRYMRLAGTWRVAESRGMLTLKSKSQQL